MRLALIKSQLFGIIFFIPYKIFLYKNKEYFEKNNIIY